MAKVELDSSYRKKAQALADTWKQRLDAGHTIAGLDQTTREGQLAEVQNIKSTLVSPNLSLTAARSNAVRATGVTAQAIDPNNPNTFPVKGSAAASGLYWFNLKLEVDAQRCGGSGCTLTDVYRSNVTVDPGARTSMIRGRNLYWNDSGNFGNKHFRMWAINRGNIVGADNTGDLSNASKDYISSKFPLNSTVLTTGITLWVYFKPLGIYWADGGKTADAYCRAKPDNACVYR